MYATQENLAQCASRIMHAVTPNVEHALWGPTTRTTGPPSAYGAQMELPPIQQGILHRVAAIRMVSPLKLSSHHDYGPGSVAICGQPAVSQIVVIH